MLDFRKQFQEIIEQSYIPFNIDKAATSDVWSNIYKLYLQPIITQYFIDNKSEIWLLFLIAHSKR